jgi:hypothetical protein
MVRFLLLVALGYLIWRFLRSLFSFVSHPQGSSGGGERPQPPKADPPPYMDIKDAEFEDITTDKDGGKPE